MEIICHAKSCEHNQEEYCCRGITGPGGITDVLIGSKGLCKNFTQQEEGGNQVTRKDFLKIDPLLYEVEEALAFLADGLTFVGENLTREGVAGAGKLASDALGKFKNIKVAVKAMY